MKERLGYVSNSSSSSFCIVGVKVGELMFSDKAFRLKDRLIKLGFDRGQVDSMSLGDAFLNLYHLLFGKAYQSKFGDLDIVDGISEHDGDVIIGFDIGDMHDDETLWQFKDRVFAQLVEIGYLGTARDMGIFVDGGME